MNKLAYTNEGRYYLGSSDIQVQYVFQFREDAPKDLQRGFLIDKEKDRDFNGSALEIAYDLQEIIDGYWISTDKPKIKAVIEYLEKWEEKDRYDELIEKISKLTAELQEVTDMLSGYDAAEMDVWVPKAIESTESPSDSGSRIGGSHE